jgi:hypothetical protein
MTVLRRPRLRHPSYLSYIRPPLTAPRPRDIPCSDLIFSYPSQTTRHGSSRVCYLHTRFPDDVVSWCGRHLDGDETTPLLPQVLISSLFLFFIWFFLARFPSSFAISLDRDGLLPPHLLPFTPFLTTPFSQRYNVTTLLRHSRNRHPL